MIIADNRRLSLSSRGGAVGGSFPCASPSVPVHVVGFAWRCTSSVPAFERQNASRTKISDGKYHLGVAHLLDQARVICLVDACNVTESRPFMLTAASELDLHRDRHPAVFVSCNKLSLRPEQ